MMGATYDNNGNTTTDDNGITYTYDAWNRIRQATITPASGSTIYKSFMYLALGQRASVTICPGSTSYSYYSADWQALEDVAPGSGSATTYVWGLGYIDDLVARDDASGNRLYVQQDANHNVTALVGKVSNVWQVVERFVYDSYGVATVLSNNWSTTSDSKNWVYRWQGGQYDSTTGLYNFRNRDYSPTLGRWMQQDPIGYVDGANLYQAMLGAPIQNVDPMGLCAEGDELDDEDILLFSDSASEGGGNAGAGGKADPDPKRGDRFKLGSDPSGNAEKQLEGVRQAQQDGLLIKDIKKSESRADHLLNQKSFLSPKVGRGVIKKVAKKIPLIGVGIALYEWWDSSAADAAEAAVDATPVGDVKTIFKGITTAGETGRALIGAGKIILDEVRESRGEGWVDDVTSTKRRRGR